MIDQGAGDDAKGAASVPVRRLAEVLQAHPRFARAHLLKTDTDGSDFEILRSSLEALVHAGYGSFLVHDNFSHYVRRIDARTPAAGEPAFAEVDRYLFSNLYFGRRIYYYDVCAFSAADADLCEALESTHRLLVEAALREDGRKTGA
jgi:hypothetical protein